MLRFLVEWMDNHFDICWAIYIVIMIGMVLFPIIAYQISPWDLK